MKCGDLALSLKLLTSLNMFHRKVKAVNKHTGKKVIPLNNYESIARSSLNRAKLIGLTEHFTAAQWEDLLLSSGKKCMACKKTSDQVALTADHVIPLARGGSNTIDNIQVLCLDCNCKKHVKTIDFRNNQAVIQMSKRIPRPVVRSKKVKILAERCVKTKCSIKYNLFALKHELEIKTGRTYSWVKIANESGVQINTIKNIAGNKTARIDLDILEKILKFFASQGMPITPNDFLVVSVTDRATVTDSAHVEIQPPKP